MGKLKMGKGWWLRHMYQQTKLGEDWWLRHMYRQTMLGEDWLGEAHVLTDKVG